MAFQYTEDEYHVYQTAHTEREETRKCPRSNEYLGLKTEVIDREAAQRIEPISARCRGGVSFKDDARLHPNSLMRRLPLLLEQRGVRMIRQAEVTGFSKGKREPYSPVRYRDAQGEHQITPIAMWLCWPRVPGRHKIAEIWLECLPLMPGKGYSMTINTDRQRLRIPCILLEAKVALTPWRTQCVSAARWRSARSTTASCCRGCKASWKQHRNSLRASQRTPPFDDWPDLEALKHHTARSVVRISARFGRRTAVYRFCQKETEAVCSWLPATRCSA